MTSTRILIIKEVKYPVKLDVNLQSDNQADVWLSKAPRQDDPYPSSLERHNPFVRKESNDGGQTGLLTCFPEADFPEEE